MNTIEEVFWSKINMKSWNECWNWKSLVSSSGNGRFVYLDKEYMAHVMAYKLYYGVEPDKKFLIRDCNNIKCCNPLHMRIIALSEHIERKFWESVLVKELDECWEWRGSKDQDGYGKLHITKAGQELNLRSHRISYEIHFGSIPEDMLVCHKCDNPPCCNPKHLFLGTNQDNITDKIKKNRGTHGENHPSSKLTWRDVLKIRCLYEQNPNVNISHLARIYGVSRMTMKHAMISKTWKIEKENNPNFLIDEYKKMLEDINSIDFERMYLGNWVNPE